MNLFLLPHAGGSAKGYCTMKRFFPQEITLVPLDPAGKGIRAKEKAFEDIPSCVADIIEKNKSLFTDHPYAVFGHSMGTILAMEMIRQLKEKGPSEPVQLFLSGRCAPDEEGAFPVSSDDEDEKIVSFFTDNGLIPEQVIKNKPLMDMFSEILCRDIRMTQKYFITPEQCTASGDISVLYGEDDAFLKGFDMNNWGKFTSGNCTLHKFSGGHFYYSSQQEQFCKCITEKLLPFIEN